MANLKYVDAKAREEADKKHPKNENVNLNNTYRVVNMPAPSAGHHGVNKTYCDTNSGKDPGGGAGSLFGALFGAIAGAISGALTQLTTQGLAAGFGTIAAQGAAAFGGFLSNGLFNGGMRVGSTSALEGLKQNNPIPNES